MNLYFITSGRPLENGYFESLHGKFPEACLNEHWFLTLNDARQTIESWRLNYNQVRPHNSLGYLTPEEFRVGYTAVQTDTHLVRLVEDPCYALPASARPRLRRHSIAAKCSREHSHLTVDQTKGTTHTSTLVQQLKQI